MRVTVRTPCQIALKAQGLNKKVELRVWLRACALSSWGAKSVIFSSPSFVRCINQPCIQDRWYRALTFAALWTLVPRFGPHSGIGLELRHIGHTWISHKFTHINKCSCSHKHANTQHGYLWCLICCRIFTCLVKWRLSKKLTDVFLCHWTWTTSNIRATVRSYTRSMRGQNKQKLIICTPASAKQATKKRF